MKDDKYNLDAFVCAGSQHLSTLIPLLKVLHPHAKVHLGSSFLSDDEISSLEGLYDVLHTPQHHDDGYRNFELFTIRDINRLATAPYFVKLDADIILSEDWHSYFEECLAAHPDAVLMGPCSGGNVNYEFSGELVRQLLQRDIIVKDACKVIGGFYIAQTSFFKKHLRFMDLIHEFMWCFKDGVRVRPSPRPEYWPPEQELSPEPPAIIGLRDERTLGNEDTLRNIVAHANGASDRVHVVKSRGRVRILRDETTFALWAFNRIRGLLRLHPLER